MEGRHRLCLLSLGPRQPVARQAFGDHDMIEMHDLFYDGTPARTPWGRREQVLSLDSAQQAFQEMPRMLLV